MKSQLVDARNDTKPARHVSKSPTDSARPDWRRFQPPPEAVEVLVGGPQLTVVSTVEELVAGACGGDPGSNYYEVAYEVPGRGRVVEATVARVRNGICANYTEAYMRRRDPDCMLIADNLPT